MTVFTHALSTNNYGVSKFIVSTSAANGTHTTLAAAAAVAVSGDVIILRDSVTENVTLPAGIILQGASGASPMPTIIGKLTFTATGTVTITNLQLQTNSDFILVCSGTNACNVYVNDCYFNLANNAGFSWTNSNAASNLFVKNCQGTNGGATTTLFTATGAGNLLFDHVMQYFGTDVTTASSNSAAIIRIMHCNFNFPLSTSSTGVYDIKFSTIECSNQNTTALAVTGTTGCNLELSNFRGGTATAITLGAGTTTTMINCNVQSTNAAAMSGAGILQYTALDFSDTSSSVTVTTQTQLKSGPSQTIGSSNGGAANTLTVTNSSNTASSDAVIVGTVGGTSAGDIRYSATVSGSSSWSWGLDNSDTDAWVLSGGLVLGTNNVIHMSANGEMNLPLQPAFLAYNANSINDVTGDGTNYIVIWDAEIFDQNADFNTGTGAFTAPVTGKYFLTSSILMNNMSVSFTGQLINIIASNRNSTFNANLASAGSQRAISVTNFVDMDAADTATIQFSVSGSTKTIDVQQGSATDLRSWYAGHLVC